MINLSLVWTIAIVSGLAFLGGFLAKKLKQSTIIGYLVAGIFLGSWLISHFQAAAILTGLAEIGIAFLMFALGLELSFKRLYRVRDIVFWGAILEILGVVVLGVLILPIFGLDFYSSLFMAAAFSLSSTAVVIKILSEKGELDTLHGEIMLGWLLIQDLAVLPMVVILPAVAGVGDGGWGGLVTSLVKAAGFLVVAILLGRKILPFVLGKVADLKSRELLLLSVVAICLFLALLSAALGLSIALGAFLAGVIISETSERHAVFSQMRPLRDIFSILFFVSLGMFLTPRFLIINLLQILGLSLGVMGLKFLVILILIFYLGYHAKTGILVSLGLVQVGEFAFVLASLGMNQGLIDSQIYSLILSVTILTLLATPGLIFIAPRLYLGLRKISQKHFPRIYSHLFIRYDSFRPHAAGLDLENHVVICGHGRVGSWITRALRMIGVPFVVIDYDHQVINKLKEKDIPVLYGDPADIDVLDYAQVEKAKVVIIAIPDRATQEMIVANCQTLNPKVKIISRVHHESDQSRLKALGVTSIIQPEFEAALSIIHRALQFFGVTREEVANKIKRIKIEHGIR